MPAAAAIPMPQSQDWTRSGERQVAPHLDGIRRDHVARYEFAVRQLEGLGLHGARVIDIACGVGYGSWIMATRARARVLGIDAFVPAIDYARQHWSAGDPQYPFAATKQDLWCAGTANYLCATAQEVELPTEQDLAVCFETIEHLTEQDALILLRKLRRSAKLLLASVPNEDEMPFGEGYAFHYRHYTQRQFEALLNAAGWIVEAWFGQLDDRAPVTDCAVGRTLVVRCVAIKNDGEAIDDPALPGIDIPAGPTAYQQMVEAFPVPEHVAILGLGPSLEQYLDITKRLGGKHAYCTETWGINAVAGVLLCDRVFHMDDVRIQEVRAAAAPESNIARMLQWLKVHPGPIITSREHPDYPGLVAFPLEDVLNNLGQAYFNSTAAYAVAYAIHIGVKHISVFGCDYTYPDAHDAEKGRGCLEFWLGIAAARGIKLTVPKTSTLLDGIYPQQDRFYGYDTLAITLRPGDGGGIAVDLQPIATLPEAAEIEERYDHSSHPNALVEMNHK